MYGLQWSGLQVYGILERSPSIRALRVSKYTVMTYRCTQLTWYDIWPTLQVLIFVSFGGGVSQFSALKWLLSLDCCGEWFSLPASFSSWPILVGGSKQGGWYRRGQPHAPVVQIRKVGQNHIYTVYIQYIWQGNHQIYGHIWCIYTVLANPTGTHPFEKTHSLNEHIPEQHTPLTTHTHTHLCLCAHRNKQTQARHARPHTQINTHALSLSLSLSLSHTHTHTHTHTNTHTNTQTRTNTICCRSCTVVALTLWCICGYYASVREAFVISVVSLSLFKPKVSTA